MRKKIIKLCIALLLGFAIYFTLKSNVRIPHKPEGEQYASKSEEESDHAMPKITNMIMGTGYYIALCEDKTIWSWGNNSTGKLGVDSDYVMEPQKITGLEGVVKIIDGGDNIDYAFDSLHRERYC